MAQNEAHLLIVGKVIGSNLGPTPHHVKMVPAATMSDT